MSEFPTSSVFVLLGISRPSAVGGTVSFIVVDAIKGQAIRLFSHVGEKIRKCLPTFTYSDAASSPIAIIVPIFVVAPSTHVDPGTKCGRSGSPMFEVQRTYAFHLAASAGLRVATQIGAGDYYLSATIATASPQRASLGSMRNRDRSQTAVAQSSSVNEFGHR